MVGGTGNGSGAVIRSLAGQRAMAIAIGMWESEQWDGAKWKHGTAASLAVAKVADSDLARCGTILAHSRDYAREVFGGASSPGRRCPTLGVRRPGPWAPLPVKVYSSSSLSAWRGLCGAPCNSHNIWASPTGKWQPGKWH